MIWLKSKKKKKIDNKQVHSYVQTQKILNMEQHPSYPPTIPQIF